MTGKDRFVAIASWYIAKGSRCTALSRCLLLSLVIAALGCDGTEPSLPQERSWHALEESYQEGLLLSVWGAAADDVWVVGGRPGKTVVLHGDQSRLDEIENPGTAMAWWVCGLGDRIAIVGEQGLAMVEGNDGELALLDLDIDATLYGCWGHSIDDFWVVGGDPLAGPAQLAHVQHGQAIAPDLGPALSDLPRVFFKVIGIEQELFIVGGDGTLLHRTASGDWELTRIASRSVSLFTVSGTGLDDIWAVGGLGNAVAVHFDGAAWNDESPELLPNLFGVSSRQGECVVAGASGALAERLGDTWQVIDTFSEDAFHSAWLDGEGGAWAVGGNVLEQDPSQRHGVIWVR
jgi:hypothetical protein